MACGNCNTCNSSDPCGCQDHGLTTPCSYTDCVDPTTERCTEVTCAECVTWCGPTSEIENGDGDTFVIQAGERLDSILQRIMHVLAAGLNPCTSSNGQPTGLYAVQNIYFGAITANSITIVWGGEGPGVTELSVLHDTATPTGWTTSLPITPGVFNYTITGLVPATEYKFRIDTTDGASNCKSIIVYAKTL
jgi:hypothetical protein